MEAPGSTESLSYLVLGALGCFYPCTASRQKGCEPLIFEEMLLAEPGQVQATLLVLSVGFCSAVTDSNYSGICVDPINARGKLEFLVSIFFFKSEIGLGNF